MFKNYYVFLLKFIMGFFMFKNYLCFFFEIYYGKFLLDLIPLYIYCYMVLMLVQ